MYYGIGDRTAYCVTGRAVILLDIERSRYFGLPETAADAFKRLLARRGELVQGDEIPLAGLLKRGHLVPIPAPKLMPLTPEIALACVEGNSLSTGRVPISYVILAIWLQMTTAIRLRLLAFPSLLNRLRARPSARSSQKEDADRRAWMLAQAFERTTSLLGRTDRCLIRSIAMVSACRRLGISAQLVIGVRSEPFVAHCWVQRDDAVLNDTVEHIRSFTPILVLA